jgi:hypothetical protein
VEVVKATHPQHATAIANIEIAIPVSDLRAAIAVSRMSPILLGPTDTAVHNTEVLGLGRLVNLGPFV